MPLKLPCHVELLPRSHDSLSWITGSKEYSRDSHTLHNPKSLYSLIILLFYWWGRVKICINIKLTIFSVQFRGIEYIHTGAQPPSPAMPGPSTLLFNVIMKLTIIPESLPSFISHVLDAMRFSAGPLWL